jgi:hypothetical protein
MRFKEFLLREQPEISVRDALEPFKNALFGKHIWYRGMDEFPGKRLNVLFDATFTVVNGRENPRSSLTENHYLLNLVSELWKDFPRRSYSASMTQSREVAEDTFGDLHIILPANSVKLFGYSEEDFNFNDLSASQKRPVFAAIAASVEEIVEEAKRAIRKSDRGHELPEPPHNFSGFAEFADELLKMNTALWEGDAELEELGMALDSFRAQMKKAKYSSVADFVKDLTPENYGVKAYHNLQDIPKEEGPDEVWFEGPYLAISGFGSPEDTMDDLRGMFEENYSPPTDEKSGKRITRTEPFQGNAYAHIKAQMKK